MKDILQFLLFLRSYGTSRLLGFGTQVEKGKDIIVALLVVKRGKYSGSFLHVSFFLLVIIVLIAGPAIAENNPFDTNEQDQGRSFQSATIGYDPFDNPVNTVISEKPRDRVYPHTVSDGETLASLSKRYGVSVDTIKWANNLKTDMIRAGQKLDIPPITGIVHKVVAGDNIYAIAKKYNTDAQSIVNFPFNDFTDPDTFQLTPGQALYVPEGTIVEVKPNIQKTTTFRQIAKAQAGVQGTSSFIWPASGNITTYPVWYHMALDIANSSAPPIIASDTGTVTYTGCLGYGYGCHVIIDHGNGYQTLYAHLSAIEVSAGQVVSKSQRIGVMGSTGRSTGTHLHFEIRTGGGPVNPLGFLQ